MRVRENNGQALLCGLHLTRDRIEEACETAAGLIR